MWRARVPDNVAHPGLKSDVAPVFEFGTKFTAYDMEDMAALAPVVGSIACRIAHEAYTSLTKHLYSPICRPSVAIVSFLRNLRPIKRRKVGRCA
jgi:hypothetical protein